MASDNEASCESDPNFAVICAFMEKFGTTCGLQSIDFLELQEMLENTQEVPQELIDLHIKLLRKSRKTVSNERWEKAIIKFCHSFCVQDAWEIERFGYKKARLSSKLRVLKELLEMQFDYNARFKAEINKMSAEELRSQPLGKDKQGHAYWFQNDNNCQIRVYKEDPDEETWTLVAKDREGLASLINELGDGDSKISTESAINEEDSNSLAEKPIIDTGQVDSSSDSNKKMSGDSENSNESKESTTKKEENISPQEDVDLQSEEEDKIKHTEMNKRARESDDDENGNSAKKMKSEIQVSEAIEEPIMLVKGEGNGEDNKCVNPIIGEEIEEDLMFVYGEGNGRDCETGNEDKNETQTNNQTDTGNESKSGNRDASDSDLVSISDSKNCVNDEVPTSPVKSPYKLGTIIDTKTDNKFFNTVKNPTKKSRWDVDTIISKETPETGRVKELVTQWEQKEVEPPKKSMFFFGPGCLQFNPATVGFGRKVPPEKTESLEVMPDKEKGDVGYRIGDEEKKTETNDCVQNLVNEVDHETPVENRIENASDNIAAKEIIKQTKVEENMKLTNEVQLAVEKDIINKNEEIRLDGNEKYPEVTAALVECQEEIQEKTINKNLIETASDLVPVNEEICVKKDAYLLGEKKDEIVENHQLEIESGAVIMTNEDVDVNAVELNEVVENKQVEMTSSIDENENKQNVSELKTNHSDITLETTNKSITNEESEVNEDQQESKVEAKLLEAEESLQVLKLTDETIENNVEKQKSSVDVTKDVISSVAEKIVDKKENLTLATEEVTVQTAKETETISKFENLDKVREDIVEAAVENRTEKTDVEEILLVKLQEEKTNDSSDEIDNAKNEELSVKSPEILMTEKTEIPEIDNTKEPDVALLETESPVETNSEEVSKDLKSKDNLEEDNCEVISGELQSATVSEELDSQPVLEKQSEVDTKEVKSDTVLEKIKSLPGSEESKPEADSEERKPETVSGEIKPETVLEEIKPEADLEVKPEVVSEEFKPETVSVEIKPETVSVERKPEAVSELKPEVTSNEIKSDASSTEPEAVPVQLKSSSVSEALKPEFSITEIESDSAREELQLEANEEELQNATILEESKSETTKNEVQSNIKDHKLEAKDETLSSVLVDEKQEAEKKFKESVLSTTKPEGEEKNKSNDEIDRPKKEAIIYLKTEDKVKVNEKFGKEESKDSLKRSRKNNSEAVDEEKKPRIATRRLTRSSKTEDLTEEKPVETPTVQQPRRGRTRSNQKTTKEDSSEDTSKKMKMSNEDTQSEMKTTKDKQNQKDETKVVVNEKTEEVEDNSEKINDVKSVVEEPVKEPETVVVESSSSSDILEITDKDPLAVSGEESKEPKPMSLASFSLDFNESPTPTPPLTRSGSRKRSRESPHHSEEPEEVVVGKRPKMKAKRAVDVKLRKSIEEQKKIELLSSDDDNKADQDKTDKKKPKKSEEAKNDESVVISSDAEKETPSKSNKKNKNKRLLSNLGIDPERVLVDFDQQPVVGVRQSRRIAQLKIKEEAERRKLEEEMLQETQKKKKSKKNEDKDYKVEKKKSKNDDDDEEGEEDSNDSKKRKKKKKKKQRKLFDESNPWRSSSDSSSSNEEDEMGEEEEEEDEDVLQYVSDHEFSPESDLEGDGEAQPLKRARTARKESDVEEVDDCPCQKCGKSDHPEWILLCDNCDNGWHCSCLRPPLLVIPEGDWFCPPCQHTSLFQKLTEKLKEFDRKLNKKEIEDRRKQRLAYVGISLNSVLPAKDTENIKKRRVLVKNEDYDDDDDDAEIDDDGSSDDESESGSISASEEDASDSDEPIYQLRQRRQAHSYRFNDYDELINSAIQDEMEAVKGAGNQGRGKDIATIVNAEKEEERKKELEATQIEGEELEPLPPVVPVDDKDKEAKPLFDPEEPITVKKKIIGRKKHRKLNALDISSADDDEDSDEDFKGTSSESEDDFDEDLGSEYSDDLDNGRSRRKGSDPVRRSTRARTSRYDADFIDDGESDSEDDAPRRKKKRSIWDESESEESDRSWGRRKRKPANRSKKSISSSTPKKKKSKKKKKQQDSDEEVYKKKKPKIKFGMDGDDDGPVRRTRGKKINYIDALGSDSDDDRGKRPAPRIESDEDFVANEDEKVSEEEVESGDENQLNKPAKIQIQSYTDARFTQLLPTPKLLQDECDELNPIDQINRNVEMMDENEMEKMMEDEEYANKHLQMVALQLEKEKRRKEREAKKGEGLLPQTPIVPPPQEKKRPRKLKDDFQFTGSMQEPLVGNVDSLIVNSENNDELSEPPGVSLPLFSELGVGGDNLEDLTKKRKNKKSLEEAVANLGSIRQQDTGSPFVPLSNKMHPTDLSMPQESNIEIAAPPQPFSQSQPTPSVITRMLQSKPGQPGYPVGTIRPKQFASMPEREEDIQHGLVASPVHPGPYLPGATAMRPQLSSPYRQLPPTLNHYPRATPPPQIRNPVPHIYHSHRPLDPSPSGGGPISISDHNSPGRVVSPAASSPGSNKNETPPPPYSRPTAPVVGRFPMISTTSAGPRHMQMVPPPHLQPPRPNLSPYHPGMPPQYHYGQFSQEDALPPTMYQNSPYSETFEGGVNPAENSNSKPFEDESGGEFGGLVSYFSSQREDDLES